MPERLRTASRAECQACRIVLFPAPIAPNRRVIGRKSSFTRLRMSLTFLDGEHQHSASTIVSVHIQLTIDHALARNRHSLSAEHINVRPPRIDTIAFFTCNFVQHTGCTQRVDCLLSGRLCCGQQLTCSCQSNDRMLRKKLEQCLRNTPLICD